MALHIVTMDTAERKITGYDQVGLNNKNASRNSAGSVTKHAVKEICRNKSGSENESEIHNVINTRDFPMHTLSLCGLEQNISSWDAVNNLSLCDVVNCNPVTLKNSVFPLFHNNLRHFTNSECSHVGSAARMEMRIENPNFQHQYSHHSCSRLKKHQSKYSDKNPKKVPSVTNRVQICSDISQVEIPQGINPSSKILNDTSRRLSVPVRKLYASVGTMIVVCFTFFLSNLPFVAVHIVDTDSSFNRNWYIVTSWLFWAGASANPIIYGIMNKRFRKSYIGALKDLFDKLCGNR